MTITAANSVFSLTVNNLYPTPQKLGGYAADDAFTSEAVELAEVVMGVDGKQSAGFVFNPTKQTITLMPDSPSIVIFETWKNTMRTVREVFPANATILMPSIKRKYTLTNGILTSAKALPDVKKLLQANAYIISWELVVGEDM